MLRSHLAHHGKRQPARLGTAGELDDGLIEPNREKLVQPVAAFAWGARHPNVDAAASGNSATAVLKSCRAHAAMIAA